MVWSLTLPQGISATKAIGSFVPILPWVAKICANIRGWALCTLQSQQLHPSCWELTDTVAGNSCGKGQRGFCPSYTLSGCCANSKDWDLSLCYIPYNLCYIPYNLGDIPYNLCSLPYNLGICIHFWMVCSFTLLRRTSVIKAKQNKSQFHQHQELNSVYPKNLTAVSIFWWCALLHRCSELLWQRPERILSQFHPEWLRCRQQR